MLSGANSTSTTGPMTRTTRPVPPPLCVEVPSSTVAVILHSHSLFASFCQGFGAADDLHDFLRDLCLAGRVCVPGERLDQLVRVVTGRLHRPLACGLLAG